MSNKISIEDLLALTQQKARVAIAMAAAERAATEHKLADSEYRNMLNALGAKYNMPPNTQFNELTGEYGPQEVEGEVVPAPTVVPVDAQAPTEPASQSENKA